MPQIRIVAFRGTGGVFNEEHPYYQEPGLIRAGHVALADVIGGKVVGFSPTPEAAERLGGERALLLELREHHAQPGCLQDDTTIFERASELAEQGLRTKVLELAVEVSEASIERIKAWYTERKEAQYNFPDDTGAFVEGEANCATFLGVLGVPLPGQSGKLERFIYAMEAKGAKPWTK